MSDEVYARPHVASKEIRGCVSMSLYGDSAVYAWGAVQNVPLARQYYPGWQCRVYMERGHYAKSALVKAGATVIEMEPLPGSGGMFWRFMAADDPQFTHVVVRDVDSRINPRDAACTEEWIASGKTLHVIKDHPYHRLAAVIGGAWGILTGRMTMCDEIAGWRHNYNYGDDEEFLHRRVWERFRPYDDFLYHDYEGDCAGCSSQIPDHEPYGGHVCERMPLDYSLPGKWGAFVLSAPHYAERRRMFAESLAANGGFLAGRVEVIIGRALTECDIPTEYPHRDAYPHYYLATQDHRALWQRAVDEGLHYAFVFEDDAVFRPDFADYIVRALMCVPDDWWAIQLGGQDWTDERREWFTDGGTVEYPNALGRVNGCMGMHGVLWSRSGMEAAIERYHARPNVTVDWEFAEWQKEERRFYTPARWVVEINRNTEQYGRAS